MRKSDVNCRRAPAGAALALLLGDADRQRSRARRHGRPRAETPAGRDRADRVGEHGVARRAGGSRQRTHQQVRRGLSRQPLLRRLPVRRRGRATGHRARQEALQVSLRQRAAALRQHGEPGSFHVADEARRHVHGAEPGGRRAPDARLPGQPFGQVVQGGALHRAPAGSPHRHGRGGVAGAPAQAQGDRGRRQRLSAHHRLRRLPRHRRRGRRATDGGHGAFCRPGCRRRAPEPVPARPRRHVDDPQDPAGPARRHDPHQRRGASPRRSTRPSSRACRVDR